MNVGALIPLRPSEPTSWRAECRVENCTWATPPEGLVHSLAYLALQAHLENTHLASGLEIVTANGE